MKIHGEYSHDNPCVITLAEDGTITVDGVQCEHKVTMISVYGTNGNIACSEINLEHIGLLMKNLGIASEIVCGCKCCERWYLLRFTIEKPMTLLVRHFDCGDDCVIVF